MTEHFTPELRAAIADQIARENELAAAVDKRDAASNPLTRILGRVIVWKREGALQDSAEHVDMVSQLAALERRTAAQSQPTPVQQ